MPHQVQRSVRRVDRRPPTHADQAPPPITPPPRSSPGAGKISTPPRRAATILCVDDEPDGLAVLDLFLRREGFSVVTAASGAEALLRIEQRMPDFIITDQSMPGMSGLELCRYLRLRYDTRHIPIILYTALNLPAVSWLYDRMLMKPTDLDVFASAIRSLLAPAH